MTFKDLFEKHKQDKIRFVVPLITTTTDKAAQFFINIFNKVKNLLRGRK